MSDSQFSGFGKFVPGFDFLQGLAKGQSSQMPGLGSWVAPTLDPKELDKRIDELKAVQFWLDQNATALKATIQALEVQKMTLATLKGMNVDMNAMAKAFRFPAAAAPAKPQPAAEHASGHAHTKPAAKSARPADKAAAPVDPMQMWGSLAQQFQAIAAGAMQEVARQAAASPMQAAKAKAANAGAESAPAPKAAKKATSRKR
jgi:hypothetical protein